MVIEHADFDGIERLAAVSNISFLIKLFFINIPSFFSKATGGEIISTFNNPERSAQVLGHCEIIEEMMIGEDKVIKFSGCARGKKIFFFSFIK